MDVRREGDELVLKPGGLRGITRVPLPALTRWDFLYEVTGRRFLAFHLGDRTAYAQLPRLGPDARQSLLATLTEITGQAPDVTLLDGERDNAHWHKVREYLQWIGSYLRLFINPMRPPRPRPRR